MSPQNQAMPSTPAQIEAMIEQRRNALSSTIDELAGRLKPAAIADRAKQDARSAVDDAKIKAKASFTTPDGQLRTDKVAAVGGAGIALLGLVVINRRRRRRLARR